MQVSISRVHFPVTALGPGRRVGVWFQGCSIQCPGCISVDTWAPNQGATTTEDLIAHVSEFSHDADGITVSGGEPFDQPAALAELLTAWRAASSQSIFVYTGREMDDVSEWLVEHPGLIDAIMTGPYRSDFPQRLALRGSDNQRLHVLTEVGVELAEYDRDAGIDDRKLDVLFDEAGNAWFAGVPARGEFRSLRKLLESQGHHVVTSDLSQSRQA